MSKVLPLDTSILDLVVSGRHGNPHDVLGAHVHDGTVTVRAFRPLADSVSVVHGKEKVRLEHEHEGIWAGVVDLPEVPDYRLEVSYPGAPAQVVDDAYRYLPTSVLAYPPPEAIAALMREVGLEPVRWRRLVTGMATLHVGRRA